MNDEKPLEREHFIQQIIKGDLARGKNQGKVHTRFPPEPNGYLHIGHAKSICLNFGLAKEFKGLCNLRFDDTNPTKEEMEYVEAIKKDVRWLGFDWQKREYFASDYFEKLYQFAVDLIQMGKAYVCSLSAEEIRQYRGTLTEAGKDSPYRNRPVKENLDLLKRMRNGEFNEGDHVLRAKIDMASANMTMRDPTMYRILNASHHRTGDTWHIYPMYDFAHGLSDSLEGITHSICTLEFENNRPLYNWFLEQLNVPCQPQQIEFARLNLSYTVLSKRKILQLVEEKHVSGWDDPRMPTLSGMRRRGYSPLAIRNFCEAIGVAKRDSLVDLGKLEYFLREDFNLRAPRVMAVLRPLKITLENYPEGKTEDIECENNPADPNAGSRRVPFSKEIYIEQEDFMENPSKKFFRLAPGREVRLKYAYYITCKEVIKDEKTGEVKELVCQYDPQSRGGGTPDGRKVRGTLHWVSAQEALNAEVRLYDHLFTRENPGESEDFLKDLNPDSLKILASAKLEPGLAKAKAGDIFQFLRQGYFCVDSKDSSPDHLVFNRTVGLRDTWAKVKKAK